MSSPVLVVGAGPVGLTLACELARYKVPLRIVDRSASRTDKSKALAVWSRTLELLERSDCADAFVAAGHTVHASRFMSGTELIAHVTFESIRSPFNFALMLPQSETERLLEERLAALGVTVERGVEMADFSQNADAVSCSVHHPDGRTEVIAADWLVGCDGAHSPVRHRLGFSFDGDTLPTAFILADLHAAGLPVATDELAIFWHEEGLVLFMPITPGRYRIVADVGRSGDGPRPEPSLGDVQAIVDRRGPGGVTLSDPIWLSAFAVNERKVDEYRSGRVFLAGDAAHVHSPAGGQGMNTGMQDAFNLAWKLALVVRGTASGDALLDSYTAERSAVAKQVLADSGRLTAIATTRNRLAQHVRNFLAHHILGVAAARNAMAERLSETAIAYRHGPLVDGSEGVRGELASGERVVAGSPFGRGDTPRFALLTADHQAAAKKIAGHSGLLEHSVRPPLREDGIWLVRPDGYVAVASKAGDWDAVDGFLQRVVC